MEDEKKQNAVDVVTHPEIVDSFQGRYKILFDTTVGGKVTNLEMAMNIMASKGWQISGGLGGYPYGSGLGFVYAVMLRNRNDLS